MVIPGWNTELEPTPGKDDIDGKVGVTDDSAHDKPNEKV